MNIVGGQGSGYSGYSGKSGYSGHSGLGLSGYSGYSGLNGEASASGFSGMSGYSGVGTSGYSGASGTSGYSGLRGLQGISGYSGIGTSGYSGHSGKSGVGVSSSLINPQVGTSYIFTAGDEGSIVTLNNAAPIAAIIDIEANEPFAIGTRIDVIQKGVGKVTFAPAMGVTLKSKGSKKSISDINVGVTIIKEDTDTWYLIGDLIV
jgi:hypothetical protein